MPLNATGRGSARGMGTRTFQAIGNLNHKEAVATDAAAPHPIIPSPPSSEGKRLFKMPVWVAQALPCEVQDGLRHCRVEGGNPPRARGLGVWRMPPKKGRTGLINLPVDLSNNPVPNNLVLPHPSLDHETWWFPF